uniref:Uncharacterized protein n=1 Tax=Ananas comosus var. bracteatus TaxID=296719 RepID=A0A6V7P0Y9_ANACO|nr:unnamed protein product [Ananas comosus var. bracteatus]
MDPSPHPDFFHRRFVFLRRFRIWINPPWRSVSSCRFLYPHDYPFGYIMTALTVILPASDNLFFFAHMDSSLNVNVSFRQLLHNICVQFSLPPPRYRMTVLTDGRLCSHVDVEVPRSSRFMEIITCHGAPFSEANQTQEDAACVAIKRLSNKLALKLEMLIWRTRNIIKTYMIVLVKSIWNFKMSMK